MRIVDVLREHNVKHNTEGRYCRSGWIQLHCPFCRGGTDPNKLYCGINLSSNFVNCWRCGPHSVGDLLSAVTRLSWPEIKDVIKELDVNPNRQSTSTPRGKLILPPGLGPLLGVHKRYLRGRQYNPKILTRLWNLQGIDMTGKLKWRIFIPVMYEGRVVSWTTRRADEQTENRYISAAATEEEINHKELLYGEDYVRHTAIVHEGAFDVWRTGPGAVATLGTRFTPAQIDRLAKYARRVICFDNEPEAQRRARDLCDQLEVFPGETYNVVLTGKDASASSPEEIEELRDRFLT